MKFANRSEQLKAATLAAKRIIESPKESVNIVADFENMGVETSQIGAALKQAVYDQGMTSAQAVSLSQVFGGLEFDQPLSDGITPDQLMALSSSDRITHIRQHQGRSETVEREAPKLTHAQYLALGNAERLTLARQGKAPKPEDDDDALAERIAQKLNLK